MRKLNLLCGVALVAPLALVAAIGAIWTPFDPVAVDIAGRLQPPSMTHWLGTDEFGRDVASRAMAGATASGAVALMTTLLATTIGTALGLLAGFFRGWFDRIVMAINDAWLAFPAVLLALGLLVVLGEGTASIILAMALAYTPAVVRIVRSSVLSVREKEYVQASRVIGNSDLYTMVRHVLPNCLTPVIVLATSLLGWVLLLESGLSFLGLGVPPPAPTWGNMLAASRPFFDSALWLSLAPGSCIALALLGINLLGDGLRDRFDPRMVTL